MEDEIVYVTAATPTSLAVIENEDYKQSYFYVPFSNKDYPEYEKDKWDRILEVSHKARHDHFINECTTTVQDVIFAVFQMVALITVSEFRKKASPLREVYLAE